MSKKSVNAISAHSLSAIELLGKLIRVARTERKITIKELAERAGVSRGLIQRIEKGDPNCSIGATFEAATIVGVPLFQFDTQQINQELARTHEKLTLLPKAVRNSRQQVNDGF